MNQETLRGTRQFAARDLAELRREEASVVAFVGGEERTAPGVLAEEEEQRDHRQSLPASAPP